VALFRQDPLKRANGSTQVELTFSDRNRGWRKSHWKKLPNGTAFERMRELRKQFACWPRTDWPTVDLRDTKPAA